MNVDRRRFIGGAGSLAVTGWLGTANALALKGKEGMTSLPQLHISEITTKPWSLKQDVQAYQQAGLGIELWESKFSEENFESEIEWLLETGISVSSLQPKVLTVFPSMSVTEPKDPAERVKLMCRAIDRFKKVLKGKTFPTNTGADLTGNEDAVWRGSVEAYKRIADYAAERDVKVAFEPLGASLMNRSTTVSNIEVGLELLHEVNHPNFGFCADSYNLWESSALDQVSQCGDRLFLVHVADWKRPRNFHDRHVPGEGIIPIGGFLERVRALNYQGPLVVELFSESVPDSLWNEDLHSVVARCKSGMAKVMTSVS